jgi:hypothetical protein
VQRRRDDYAAWSEEVLELDTGARTADEVADALLAHERRGGRDTDAPRRSAVRGTDR